LFHIMPESKGNIIGFRGTGKLTERDYQEVLFPKLEALINKRGKIRLLVFLDEEFAGHELGAFWEDTKFLPRHREDLEEIVIVGGPKWVDFIIKLFAPLMKGNARTFPSEQLEEAWDWIKH
jgi:hypothetical protein